ncbi:MAG TPA: hypothetical protein VLV87_03170 [Gammaproteobacteria bacterium]|nr:hypothetical protein [Gammaproteobacteria bacterium]
MSNPQDNALKLSAAEIVANLATLEAERNRIALEAFRILEQQDRDTASLAMAVFDDREDAAIWFTRSLPFAGVSPWDLLAAGEVEKVRAILKTVPEGMYFFD